MLLFRKAYIWEPLKVSQINQKQRDSISWEMKKPTLNTDLLRDVESLPAGTKTATCRQPSKTLKTLRPNALKKSTSLSYWAIGQNLKKPEAGQLEKGIGTWETAEWAIAETRSEMGVFGGNGLLRIRGSANARRRDTRVLERVDPLIRAYKKQARRRTIIGGGGGEERVWCQGREVILWRVAKDKSFC